MRKTEQMRIKLSNEAWLALERMVAKINHDFHGGRVEHGDLMSWLVLHFEVAGLEAKMETIRTAHFDQLTYMRHLVAEEARARKGGGGPEDRADLMAALLEKTRQHASLKKNAKPRTNSQINRNSGLTAEAST